MAWTRARAEKRIGEFLSTVPQTAVSVETFETRYAREVQARASTGRPPVGANPIVHIPPSQAVLVNGVHVYVQLTDYHALLLDTQRERVERDKRNLKFLHTHYSASDQIVIAYEAQRVDYHGPRLHAVIATPTGEANELQRINRALDFAMAMKHMIEAVGDRVLGGEFRTGVRIGIDSGMAVAVNSGRADEQEPLFLGNPANQAAKLADGDEPGIFLSDRVRELLGMSRMGDLARLKRAAYVQDAAGTARVARMLSDERIRMMAEDVRVALEPQLRDAEFHFHRHEPPLSTIDYSVLMPSNSIQMQMMSIFADLSGFTRYVQRCIETNRVRELVSNLHVIRKELAAVLKQDFDGKKVRFIGDCLHGILAKGTRSETDAPGSIEAAVLCAGGMRSSFELCQTLLPGIPELGLAIGLEYGGTPVTRLGSQGERSVRCASSRAVSEAERVQSVLTGKETGLGVRALAKASVRVRNLFGATGRAPGLNYAAVAVLALPMPAVAASTTSAAAGGFRPYSER